jgi:hypothetical protein
MSYFTSPGFSGHVIHSFISFASARVHIVKGTRGTVSSCRRTFALTRLDVKHFLLLDTFNGSLPEVLALTGTVGLRKDLEF